MAPNDLEPNPWHRKSVPAFEKSLQKAAWRSFGNSLRKIHMGIPLEIPSPQPLNHRQRRRKTDWDCRLGENLLFLSQMPLSVLVQIPGLLGPLSFITYLSDRSDQTSDTKNDNIPSRHLWARFASLCRRNSIVSAFTRSLFKWDPRQGRFCSSSQPFSNGQRQSHSHC